MFGLRQRLMAFCTLGVAALLLPLSVSAQELPRSPILTIDSDLLYAQSAFGKRVENNFAADGALLEAENRRIEGELQEEERQLTERRAQLSPQEFRKLADVFDEKVQRIRQEQNAKLVALTQSTEQARGAFLSQISPVLKEIMVETGAAVIVERRSIFMSANSIDVTLVALQRIDAQLGDGNLAEPAKD